MDELKDFLQNYSLDDLAKGLFALNLWLPNIASPIKSQYLYTLVEEICQELPTQNKINSYEEFVRLSEQIIEHTPSFIMLEDYVPEEDWNDIKYYYKKRFYKIFYGGDLSNPYEFYYSFEIIHKWFKDYYMELIGRSPFAEFKFALDLQDYILKNLHQEKPVGMALHPGDFSVPTREFWNSVVTFIDGFEPVESYGSDLINLYTHKCGTHSEKLSLDKFTELAFEGKNCNYYFMEKKGKYYPTLPRRYFSVVFDRWGEILKDKYPEILELEKVQGKKPEHGIYVALIKFLRTRFEKDEFFEFATPVHPDMKAQGTVFAAVHSKNKIFMIYVTPPSVSKEVLEEHLKELVPKLAECKKLLQLQPTRLALLIRNEYVEFRSKDDESLEPRFLVVIPYCTTGMISCAIPKDLDADVMGLDQFSGLMDEMVEPDELSDFFDYVDEVTSSAQIPGITSYLDLYGSYKDSSSVLIPGANQPDFIMLDFGWGSSIRFRTLKKFWSEYPENDFFGHPMSWVIPEERKTRNGLILDSRNYMGYAYCQRVSEALFYINAPVHLMGLQQGSLTDSLMHSLADSLELYLDQLKDLSFCKSKNKVQVIFFPSSLVSSDDALRHVCHLQQNTHLWEMDIVRISLNDFGVRVVFNDEMLLDALDRAIDRTLQMSLLIDVLKQMNAIWPDPDINTIELLLEKEKCKKPRFKMMKLRKKVDYPEAIKPLLPEDRDFKLANKVVARFAHEIGIEPGTYSGKDAKPRLDGLIEKIVNDIDSRVLQFSFSKSLPLLLGKMDALVARDERDEAMVKMSLDHEVDYERAEWSSDKHQKFIRYHKDYRYLVEKFVQHHSQETTGVTQDDLKRLVALVDRLLDVRVASDFLHYGIYPAEITIDNDFIVTIKYGTGIGEMQEKYGKEQAKLRLGEIGIDTDAVDCDIPIDEYLGELNEAFKNDLGFGISDFVNVLQILSRWPSYCKTAKEDTQYFATLQEIADVCVDGIKEFDEGKIPAIIDFLELKPGNLLRIEGQADVAKDLPTWEHNKRLTRYSIRPLIKIGNVYHWGPHSTDRAAKIWVNTTSNHRLPVELPGTKNISSVLLKAHRSVESSLVKKAEEIARRFTSFVETGVQPHKIDKYIGDNRYGDYDVLVYINDKNILLNIESKIIDPDFCLKDLQRTQRQVFLGRTKSDGSFQKPDVMRVEERAIYLEKEYQKLMDYFGWRVPTTTPRVVSIFLTRVDYWWTMFPPVVTQVNFIQVKLLDDFIRNL